MYTILIKVPVTKYDEAGNITEQHSNPQDVFVQARRLKPDIPEVGQIHINNALYTSFGFVSETDDVSVFDELPDDVEVVANKIIAE